jgi:PEP-CTERM motif
MKSFTNLASACLLAAGMAVAGSSAAAQLSTAGGTSIDLTSVNGTFNPHWFGSLSDYSSAFNLSSMLRGATLLSNEPGNLTFSLVGYEAGYNNAFTAGGQRLDNRLGNMPLLGNSFSFASLAAAPLDFSFLSNGIGALFGNGSSSTGVIMSNNGQEALLVFNDTYFDNDFDDMVVRVSISAVPEPETFAMLLGGLGLLAAAVRRQKLKSTVTTVG